MKTQTQQHVGGYANPSDEFFRKIMKISFFTIRGRKQSQNKNINIKNYGGERKIT